MPARAAFAQCSAAVRVFSTFCWIFVDFLLPAKYAEMVSISGNNSSFVGPKEINSVKKGVLESDVEIQTHFLTSSRNENGLLQHKLNISIEHNSLNKRPYLSANLCDEWMRCEGATSVAQELVVTASNGTNRIASGCKFIEEMTLNLTDNFLKESINKGFNRFYSNRPDKFGEHSGLGLNIVKNLVDLHDGEIVASNRLDRDGAIVEIRFPSV